MPAVLTPEAGDAAIVDMMAGVGDRNSKVYSSGASTRYVVS